MLASSPEAGAVAEMPWLPVWNVGRLPYLYQRVHGREVVTSTLDAIYTDSRLAFRNSVGPAPELVLASRARWLVIHRDPPSEETELPVPGWDGRPAIVPLGVAGRWRREGGRLSRYTESIWGPADYSGERLDAWDLDRVRRRRDARDAAR